jgi:hypothetical protein
MSKQICATKDEQTRMSKQGSANKDVQPRMLVTLMATSISKQGSVVRSKALHQGTCLAALGGERQLGVVCAV